MTSQLEREWNGPIFDVFATFYCQVDKPSQFETSKQHTNSNLNETDQFNTLQRGHN